MSVERTCRLKGLLFDLSWYFSTGSLGRIFGSQKARSSPRNGQYGSPWGGASFFLQETRFEVMAVKLRHMELSRWRVQEALWWEKRKLPGSLSMAGLSKGALARPN